MWVSKRGKWIGAGSRRRLIPRTWHVSKSFPVFGTTRVTACGRRIYIHKIMLFGSLPPIQQRACRVCMRRWRARGPR